MGGASSGPISLKRPEVLPSARGHYAAARSDWRRRGPLRAVLQSGRIGGDGGPPTCAFVSPQDGRCGGTGRRPLVASGLGHERVLGEAPRVFASRGRGGPQHSAGARAAPDPALERLCVATGRGGKRSAGGSGGLTDGGPVGTGPRRGPPEGRRLDRGACRGRSCGGASSVTGSGPAGSDYERLVLSGSGPRCGRPEVARPRNRNPAQDVKACACEERGPAGPASPACAAACRHACYHSRGKCGYECGGA